jgi:hypothetical protein
VNQQGQVHLLSVHALFTLTFQQKWCNFLTVTFNTALITLTSDRRQLAPPSPEAASTT